jgi:hypothetical protein
MYRPGTTDAGTDSRTATGTDATHHGTDAGSVTTTTM